MKTYFMLPLLAGMASLSGLASAAEGDTNITEQELRAIGPLPEDKVAETVKKSDRNPFAERQVAELLEDKGESEDTKIRSILARIPISGVIKDRDGRFKVMLGRRLLAEGDKVPPLVASQTALLRVSKVTDKLVEISWVEDQANQTPRKAVCPVKVNEGRIDQMMIVPGEDGKSGNTLRIPVTARGEYLQEDRKDPASATSSSAATTALRQDIMEEEAPRNIPAPIREMNHRPAEPSLRSLRGTR